MQKPLSNITIKVELPKKQLEMFFNCVNARMLYFEEMHNIAKEENRPNDAEFWAQKIKDCFDLRWTISEAIIENIFGNVD